MASSLSLSLAWKCLQQLPLVPRSQLVLIPPSAQSHRQAESTTATDRRRCCIATVQGLVDAARRCGWGRRPTGSSRFRREPRESVRRLWLLPRRGWDRARQVRLRMKPQLNLLRPRRQARKSCGRRCPRGVLPRSVQPALESLRDDRSRHGSIRYRREASCCEIHAHRPDCCCGKGNRHPKRSRERPQQHSVKTRSLQPDGHRLAGRSDEP